jgi:ligand-binding sensor domain-containing protein/two-component sensor histidine kinase
LEPWPLSGKLRQSTVTSIVYATDGALWITTLAGVTRYDGIDFFDYYPHRSKEGFIASSNIVRVLKGKNGQIFAASKDAGLLQFDQNSNSFFSPGWLSDSYLSTKKLSTAFSDLAGNIWLGYETGHVFRISPQTQKLQHFSLDRNEVIIDFAQGASIGTYAATNSGNIYALGSGPEQLEPFNLSTLCRTETLTLSVISSINENVIWAGTKGSGVYILDIQKGTCEQFSPQNQKEYGIKNANIKQIYYDEQAALHWIASDQGVYQVDSNLNLKHFDTENSNLSDNEVSSITPGTQGMIWIGTYSGLDYSIPTIFEVYDRIKHEQLHSVVAIESAHDNRIWIATYEGLLYYDPVRNTHIELRDSDPEIGFIDEKIMSLHTNSQGIWVGYRSSGLQHFSLSDRTLASYGLDNRNRISSNSVSTILTASNGEILIGTFGGGLNIISADGNIDSYSVGDDRVIMLHQTRNETIWIGTESTLFKLNLPSRQLKAMEFTSSVTQNQVKPIIWSMAEAPSGGIWFGTMHHGLFFLPKATQGTSSIDLVERIDNSSLAASSIYAIEIDDLNNVWFSTNRGLKKHDPITKTTQLFSRHHGLPNAEFDFGVSHKDSNGLLYFGGSKGYIKLDPEKATLAIPPPQIVIQRIEFSGNSITPDNSLKKPNTLTLTLTHKDYFVKFDFSVLDFLDPENNQYRYKLEGFDPDWIENGTRNSATYTNLPAGDYVLRVQGANSAGVWNREGASLNVGVEPPPWYSWWAFCIYGFGGSVLFWMAMRSYHSYAVERRAVQLATQMHQDAELADDEMQEQLEIQDDLVKSVYRHNVATLKLVADFISKQNPYLTDSNDREAEQNSVKRINALAVLEACLYYQNDTLLADLNKFTDSIISRLLPESPVSVETITTINEVSSQLIPFELASPLSIAIYELIENAIQHAFDEDSPANYIQITFGFAPGSTEQPTPQYQLTVQDNGLGMPGNIEPQQAETSGLAIVQSMAAKLSGTLSFTSDRGTTVTLRFPSGNQS